MKRRSIKKLGLAVATLAIMAIRTEATFSYDVAPVEFLKTIQTYVGAGDITHALASIARLRAIGVTAIRIDDRIITLEELEGMIRNSDSQASLDAIVALIDEAMASAQQAFVFVDNTPVNVDSESLTVFPTSSAG